MARTIEELRKNIAHLEKTNAQFIDDLLDADQILREIGFKEGLKTVKEAAREIITLKSRG